MIKNSRSFEELTSIVKNRFDSKSSLVSWIKKNLNIKITQNTSYDNIFSTVIKKQKEKDFSAKLFHCQTFNEIIEKSEINDALYIFSKDELILFANQTSHNQKKWKYDKSTNQSIIKSIVRNTAKQDFKNLFPKLMLEKQLFTVVQYYKSVVGPLGITRAKENRKAMAADELASLLSEYITNDTYEEFVKYVKIQDDDIKNISDQLRPLAVQQLLLSNYSIQEIISIFNKLIDEKVIKIENVRKYWNCTITPCGLIIDIEAEPIQNLVDILIKKIPNDDLEKELARKGYSSGTLSDRVYALCMEEKPEQILDREFGKSDLKQLAKNLGLVNVAEIDDKSSLIQYVMLKLGFTLPQKPRGISNYLEELEQFGKALRNTNSDETGIITKVYVIIEKVLKDLIYFYSFILVTDLLRKKDVEEIGDEINKKIKEKFSLETNVSRLMLGKLLNLLKKLNDASEEDNLFKNFIKEKLQREELIPHIYLDEIGTIIDNRARFTHDHDASKKPSKLLSSSQIIESAIRIMKRFVEDKIYPTSINVIKEISDQYNNNYYEVLLENGNTLVVVTDNYGLEIGKPWFMINFTDKIAVKPIIVERFW